MMSLRQLSSASRCWLLSLVLVAGMSLQGCSDEPDNDAPIPDDDDSGISADDDDTGDDDTGDDDTGDDDTGDDDDTTPPPAADCNVQSVVDSSCAEVQWRQPSIAVAMSSCPEGDYVFDNAVGWSLFLAKCGGVASDPLGAHDWTQEAMVVTIREGSACFPLSSVLWFANCSDGHHFGHAFELCGDCETTQLVVNFVAVPAGRTPIQFHECLPDTLSCP
jgi:hypothetical protein